MTDCVFCNIVTGKISHHKVWEDKRFLAILDIFPNSDGMTLVVSKKHYTSDVFSVPEKAYFGLWKATKKVAKLLEKRLGVGRVAVVAEGMGIDHIHLKLYPLHGISKTFKPFFAKKKIFFKKYPGYITTLIGPRSSDGKLEKLAAKIRKSP